MRTKALVCAALAAGAMTASAQVYSANIVGYYNVTCPSGFTMLANQLNASPNNAVVNVFSSSLPMFSLMTWDGANFLENVNYGGAWDDDAALFSPGMGAFVKNDGAEFTITFVGEVPTGTLTTSMPYAFNLVGSQVPQGGNLETDLGLVPAPMDSIMTWDGANYLENVYYGGGAWDADPIVTVGQGFFYKNNATDPVVWTRTFTPTP